MKKAWVIVLLLSLAGTGVVQAQRIVHFGLDFGFDIPLHQKSYGSQFSIDQSLNFEIGAFVRAGKGLYGQVGLYYYINKLQVTNTSTGGSSPVELGQLCVPALLVYGIPWGKSNMFTLKAGVEYRGIVRLTENKIAFGKDQLRIHNMDITGGIGVEIKNVSINAYYRKSIKPLGKIAPCQYYQDVICLSVGVII